MLAFARTVDDAPHHSDFHGLHAWVLLAPHRHLSPKKIIDLFGQFLERGAGGAAAAGARRDAGHEIAQTQRLDNFGRNYNFLGAGFARLRRE